MSETLEITRELLPLFVVERVGSEALRNSVDCVSPSGSCDQIEDEKGKTWCQNWDECIYVSRMAIDATMAELGTQQPESL